MRSVKLVVALCGAMLAACAADSHRSGALRGREAEEGREGREAGEELEMGPPPPGYWRITADPVPGWTPEEMNAPPPTDGPGVWAPVGPRPISNEYWSGNANAGGRVVSIAVNPSTPSTVYIGSASGGVWKTTDGGTNWAPITDSFSILNHGAVALDPSNPTTVLAGTGEYTTGSGGDGLFRSTDAGATWTRIATTGQVGTNTSRVAVDPTNSLRIHVSGSNGYIRSTDGGATWSTRLSGSCSDLAVNPLNPQTLYVAKYSDGVYRSTDGGTTLTKLTSGLPATGMRRIVLALCAGTPTVVYAAFADTGSGLLGLYKTIDGGNTWAQLTATPNFPSPQAWYDMCLAVHPTDPNTVYAGGVDPTYANGGVIKSTNGGAAWTDVTIGTAGGRVHPDIQTLTVAADGTVWVGCDGGVWKTSNGGTSWTNCNATLAATQIYQLSLHPTSATAMIGGTQDNGTANRVASDPWPQILSGDGGFSAYDFSSPTRRYVTYVYLTVYRISGGTSDISGPWGSDPAEFIAPLIMDPNNSHTLLGGTNRVWRTTTADTTASWTAISPTSVAGGATLTALAVAKNSSNTIYAGGSNGMISFTTNGGTTWTAAGAVSVDEVGDLVVSPTAPNTVYASFAGANGTRVARSSNNGVAWTSLTGMLPVGVRAKALAVDWRFSPPALWVGSGAGIYYSTDEGATWARNGTDLPNVNIGDLQIDSVNNTITAGTYGRGAWRSVLPPPGSSCYANCDSSTQQPVLNVADFTCFLQRFAANDAYANCDNSTQQPVLNVADFTCFLQRFAAGCP